MGNKVARNKTMAVKLVVICILFSLTACRKDREEKEKRRKPVVACDEKDDFLSDVEKQTLLTLARRTVEAAVRKRRRLNQDELTRDLEITGTLKRPAGVFVTLKNDGRLRGCIGSLQPVEPLYKAVISNGVNAASRDRRFRPVGESELGDLDIEVSVLTEPVTVKSHEDIIIGCHGIIFEKGGRRSTFLPHIATEQGWNLTQTLEQLSLKANLDRNAWRSGASFQVYTAIVFSENTD